MRLPPPNECPADQNVFTVMPVHLTRGHRGPLIRIRRPVAHCSIPVYAELSRPPGLLQTNFPAVLLQGCLSCPAKASNAKCLQQRSSHRIKSKFITAEVSEKRQGPPDPEECRISITKGTFSQRRSGSAGLDQIQPPPFIKSKAAASLRTSRTHPLLSCFSGRASRDRFCRSVSTYAILSDFPPNIPEILLVSVFFFSLSA